MDETLIETLKGQISEQISFLENKDGVSDVWEYFNKVIVNNDFSGTVKSENC